MIYLIDDNQNNQRTKSYNINFIEENIFNGTLSSIEKIEKRDGLKHLDFLKDTDCILLHSTTEDYDKEKGFLPGSKTNVTKIIEDIAQHGKKIPLVLFSLQEGAVDIVKPNFIKTIKKNVFYENLYDFLSNYKETGKIELKILLWGKNFVANEVSEYANKIIKTIGTEKRIEYLKITHLSSTLDTFKAFIDIASTDLTYNEILIDIEDNPITIREFINKINQIAESFYKYGKNIYSWK